MRTKIEKRPLATALRVTTPVDVSHKLLVLVIASECPMREGKPVAPSWAGTRTAVLRRVAAAICQHGVDSFPAPGPASRSNLRGLDGAQRLALAGEVVGRLFPELLPASAKGAR